MKLFIPFIVILLSACSAPKQAGNSTTEAFQTSTLADVRIDAALINRMDSHILNQTYPNIHSVLIARNNNLVYEKYYTGKDANWGRDLGIVTHNKDSLHDIRSVTKSIVSALVGIAVSQGKITSVDQNVLEFFPEYKHLDTGLKSQLTVKHLLTMSTGLVWDESIPYSNPNNSEIQMIRSGDPVRFVLNQPMDKAPGLTWKYNGGATQLLASIVEKTSSKKIDEFANEYLFQPLGIKHYYWHRYPNTDIPAAASGLRLTSRDLLKFGLLYLNEGKHYQKQIIPVGWVNESIAENILRTLPNNPAVKRTGYGYQFFTRSVTAGNKLASSAIANGNGDQRIFIDKENNLVVVITAGNYDKWNITNNADALVYNFIYPALR